MSPAATIVGSVFVSENDAACSAPVTVAVTRYEPEVLPAVSGGVVAMPALLVVITTDAAPPGNEADVPLAGAANVTFAPLTGPEPSATRTESGDANAEPIIADCPEPADG